MRNKSLVDLRSFLVSCLAVGIPALVSADEQALVDFQLCLLREVQPVVEMADEPLGRAGMELIFTAVSSRCWIEQKKASYEAAVNSKGVEGAKSLRMDELDRDLGKAVISDLVTDLMGE